MAPPIGSIPWNKGKKNAQIPWNKNVSGYHVHSEEWKQKLSEASRIRRHTEETKSIIGKKNSEILKGRKLSDETKKKMSESRKGILLGRKHSDESKLKMSVARKGKQSWNKGIKMTGVSHDKQFKVGFTPWNKGLKFSEEVRSKMSTSKIGLLVGENHPMWKGGISKIDKLVRNMKEYRDWRSSVFSRDSWTCQNCNISDVYVTAHHKISFSSIIKSHGIKTVEDARTCEILWNIDNGVTLCETCHSTTDNYKGRCKKVVC